MNIVSENKVTRILAHFMWLCSNFGAFSRGYTACICLSLGRTPLKDDATDSWPLVSRVELFCCWPPEGVHMFLTSSHRPHSHSPSVCVCVRARLDDRMTSAPPAQSDMLPLSNVSFTPAVRGAWPCHSASGENNTTDWLTVRPSSSRVVGSVCSAGSMTVTSCCRDR